jgi:hypothetical protein
MEERKGIFFGCNRKRSKGNKCQKTKNFTLENNDGGIKGIYING